ncbi:MAG: hypothetical protein NUV35_09830, partial [Syntrophomonadaceae bacterium]|nr:hypothetical protein [Syntrophomonadaceae bacterium]
MNSLLAELDAICQRHRLEEKVLLVPSWTVGREALHTLARDFGGWVNLRAATPQGLAMEVAGPGLAGTGLRFVGPREARGLVEAICRRLQEEGGLAYYRLHADGTGLVSAIHEAV